MIDSGFEPHQMPTQMYVEENRLAATLAVKRSSGVARQVNLGECVTQTPLPNTNKADQSHLHHQKPKISTPIKILMSSKIFFYKKLKND